MSDDVTTNRNTVAHMRDAVFVEGLDRADRLSRFWLLLALSAVIASAGVVADSTATVIGAMIVAPLMTPILGTMLAVVLGDRANFGRSLALVAGGAAAAIAIGWLAGRLGPLDVVAETNAQVAARVEPRLVDLVAALATGAVGSIALVRRDIADTLPGVAIAISLVPPLVVVGLTAEAGAWDQAGGALLLFTTNVTAILATGILVMAVYRVHRAAALAAAPGDRRLSRRGAMATIVGLVAVICIPLAATSSLVTTTTLREQDVEATVSAWAAPQGWKVVTVSTQAGEVVVRLEGTLPAPDRTSLEDALRSAGVDPAEVEVELFPTITYDFDVPADAAA